MTVATRLIVKQVDVVRNINCGQFSVLVDPPKYCLGHGYNLYSHLAGLALRRSCGSNSPSIRMNLAYCKRGLSDEYRGNGNLING
jgi:hypothetical protein